MSEYRRNYGTARPDLRPDFFVDAVKDELASQGAGRDIFREVERVRIIIPGAVASIVVKNVDDTHRQRWPEAYAAFKAGREAPLTGMPLDEWPVLNRAQTAELKHLQIRTVEELASLSDVHVQSIGMGGQMLRERARAWLDEAAHEALTTKLSAENDVLRSRVAALEAQTAELGRQMLTMAQQQRAAPAGFGDGGHPFAGYVPGREDPYEQIKAVLPGSAPALSAPASALDNIGPPRPPRHPRPASQTGIDFDPAAGSRDDAA